MRGSKDDNLEYVDHSLIRPRTIEARLYQQVILNTAVQGNTLVVLPTGLGKTSLSIMLAARRIKQFSGTKILMMAPTRPLVMQHKRTFEQSMDLEGDKFQVLTGYTPPSKRGEIWKSIKLAFATPQVVERDIITGKLQLKDFSLVVFDEAHRALGDYPYGFVAERYMGLADNPLILGLTASPGGAKSRIEKIKSNLFIDKVEARSEEDPDVAPYVQPVKIERRMLELPESFAQIKNFLEAQLKDHLRTLKKCEFLDSIQNVGKKELLDVQKRIRGKMQELVPNPNRHVFKALMAQAAAFRISHAVELLETQGLNSLCSYLDRLKVKAGRSGSPKAVKLLVSDPRMEKIFRLAESCKGRVDNPKLKETQKIVLDQLSKNSDSKIMVFAHYRDSASQLVDCLRALGGVNPARFVGQTDRNKDKGLSQKEQFKILDKFRNGSINVLVSTAVGEEGLDIPNVELAIFYEAVPSGIRNIQRRGRTGRKSPGKVIALLMKGTRDEAFYWSAVHKERHMRKTLHKMGEKKVEGDSQRSLKDF